MLLQLEAAEAEGRREREILCALANSSWAGG
eukprot:COSAG06_NODE_8427_length_2178_cov_1.858586_3_plen_30_part_01